MFPQAGTSATSLWYGHSPVSGMAPAGTLCSGVFTTVSFFWQRNSFLDVFLRKLLSASQFIYHVCRDHRLGIFQPDHTCSHRKNAGSHVLIGSFLLRRPRLPVCTEIRTDPDDHFRDQLPSGALSVFQAPCKTQYLPCRSDKRNPVFPLYCVYDLQFLHTIYVSAVLERV